MSSTQPHRNVVVRAALSSIRLTPHQANIIVDVCQRLDLAAPVRDGELPAWLKMACRLMLGYMMKHKPRAASQDSMDVVIDCLRDAFSGITGYDRMTELVRAEEYLQKHIDKK